MATNGASPAADWADLADYITTEEAADLSGYHVNYIRRIMRQGKIKGRKAGIVWLIERPSLLEYLATVQALGTKKFTPDRFKNEGE